MKIKQQKQIKEFLNKEFKAENGAEIFRQQEIILNECIQDIKDKSKNQKETLIQTILPRIALYKAMQQYGLSNDEIHKYMQKYMIDIVAKQW